MGDGIQMGKIRDLSLRKTIVLYVAAALLLGFTMAALVVSASDHTQKQIWDKYSEDYEEILYRPTGADMSSMDYFISEVLCDSLQTWSMLVIPLLCCLTAVLLFYRHKIKEPLEILNMSSKRISENDLDFRIYYRKKDEMGQLCKEFETMRRQLYENNKELWTVVEQEKVLKAAIAHDIRTPLTVLRGYQEMLLEFMPQEKLDIPAMEEMLQAGLGQIDRLNNFVEMMHRLSALEQRELHYESTTPNKLAKQILSMGEIICKEQEIKLLVNVLEPVDDDIYVDANIVYEVFENLLANAIRFAEKVISIELQSESGRLMLMVRDDGSGFTGKEGEIGEAFYRSGLSEDLKHFGLGLYLCNVYCGKHGGKLLIGNAYGGGACIKAYFESRN